MSYCRVSAAAALLGCLTATAITSTPANAADLWGRHEQGSIKDAPPVEPAFTWRGFYVGGHAGLATGETTGRVKLPEYDWYGESQLVDSVQRPAPLSNLLSSDYNLSGALYGGHIGFNHQMGNMVLGLEGTYSAADIDGSDTCVVIFKCSRDVKWLATAEGRIGYAFGHSMVYGRGGIAWGEVDTSVDFLGLGLFTLKGSETHMGWTAGFGFEHAITNNIIARVEYSHIDLGEETHQLSFGGGGGFKVPSKVDVDIDTIKVGVSLKFGG